MTTKTQSQYLGIGGFSQNTQDNFIYKMYMYIGTVYASAV